MAKKKHTGTGSQKRRISVRGVRRSEPDIRKLSQAYIGLALAIAQAEADAEREAAETLNQNPKAGDGDERVA
jgi:hypothetical protein